LVEKGIQKRLLNNYQGAFSVLDHSTSARDREKRKLTFVDKIFIILLYMHCVSFEIKKHEFGQTINAVGTRAERRMFPKR